MNKRQTTPSCKPILPRWVGILLWRSTRRTMWTISSLPTAIRRTGGASWQCISKSSLQHCALLSAWIKRTNPICLAGKDPTRKEPTITPITVGQALEANIMDGSDQDLHRLSGVKSKTVTVHLENQSTTLRPMIRALNADKSVLQGGDQANVEGANFDYSFPVEPGKEYFVVVKSYEDSSAGKYKISTH